MVCGHEISPGRGKGRIFRVFEHARKMEAGGPTDLRQSFKEFASRPRQTGLTVIISDFLDPGGFDAGLKILRTLGHDVFVVHIASERDRDPGAFGDVQFVDTETGDMREVEVTPRLAAAYVAAWEAHAAELEHFCGRYGIGYVRADAERPFEDDRPQGVPAGAFPRMTFGAMAAWQAWLLLGGAAGLAAWLFLRKLRPPRVLVSSLLLWARVLDETRELTLWERIRRAVSLVLTIAIALCTRARRHPALATLRHAVGVARAGAASSSTPPGRCWRAPAAASRAGTGRWREARRLAAARPGDPWRSQPPRMAWSRDRRPTWR